MYEIEMERTYPDGTASKTRVRVRSWPELQNAWDRLAHPGGDVEMSPSPFDPADLAGKPIDPFESKYGQSPLPKSMPPTVGPDILKDMRDKFADDALTQNYFETTADWERAIDCIMKRTQWEKNRFEIDSQIVLAICRPFAYGKKTVYALVHPTRVDDPVNPPFIMKPHDGVSPTGPDEQLFTFTAIELLGPKAAELPPVEALS